MQGSAQIRHALYFAHTHVFLHLCLWPRSPLCDVVIPCMYCRWELSFSRAQEVLNFASVADGLLETLHPNRGHRHAGLPSEIPDSGHCSDFTSELESCSYHFPPLPFFFLLAPPPPGCCFCLTTSPPGVAGLLDSLSFATAP